jgi:hypothetical protein
MVQPQYSPQEALERVKLMMKYDTSKTLNENREIIFEQASTPGGISQKAVDKIIAFSIKNKKGLSGSNLNPPQQQAIDAEFGNGTYIRFFENGGKEMLINSPTTSEPSSKEEKIAELFYDKASSGAGTNPDKMLEAIRQIDNKDLFWKVNDLVKNKSGMDIAGVINDELESGNYTYIIEIRKWLTKIGINTEADMYSNSWKIRSFKITSTPTESKSNDTPTPTTDPYSKFPCVKKHRKAVKGKDVNGNDIYTINGVVYYGNGRKRLSNGTMASYTCKSPEFITKKQAPEIPKDLDGVEGVRAFQNWLDDNHGDDKKGQGEGWATGLPDGKLSQAGGYGRFGPRTSAAWKLYKTEYLNRGNSKNVVDDNTGNPYGEYDTDEVDTTTPVNTNEPPQD